MKIAVLLTGIGVLPERRNNVSGHVQIPLKTCELLNEVSHETIIIATRQADGNALPACLPDDTPVKFVPDGRKRGQLGYQNARPGYNMFALLKQIRNTVKLIKQEKVDVVHVFGFERMIKFAGLIKLLTGKPVVATLMGGRPSKKWKWVYGKVDHVTCLTQSVASHWSWLGDRISVNRPGVVRNMTIPDPCEPDSRNRVLFWREASLFGGADLCIKAFDVLAPKFPKINFDFAVRRNKDEVPELEPLAQKHSNVNIHRFPYEGGKTLEQLIDESIVAVLPYRDLSIEPQMAVVETLSVGCPVISSDIRCLPELVVTDKTGWTVPNEDIPALTAAIEYVLENTDKAKSMRPNVGIEFHERWNWDSYREKLGAIYDSVLKK